MACVTPFQRFDVAFLKPALHRLYTALHAWWQSDVACVACMMPFQWFDVAVTTLILHTFNALLMHFYCTLFYCTLLHFTALLHLKRQLHHIALLLHFTAFCAISWIR